MAAPQPSRVPRIRYHGVVGVRIRSEAAEDAAPIEAITIDAFASATLSDHREHLILDALRKAGQLTFSLVAELDSELVGHIAASPVTISDGSPDWIGLGPVSVMRRHQRRGIGSALVHEALRQLVEARAAGCVVLGDPAYYRRFGFRVREDLTLTGVPREYFQAIAFREEFPRGAVRYHVAFAAASQ
jgi:putative acetyltransferase